MPANNGKEWTFNTVAEIYEKIRPGYPDELYQALFAYAPLDDSRSALEIGIGAGQAFAAMYHLNHPEKHSSISHSPIQTQGDGLCV